MRGQPHHASQEEPGGPGGACRRRGARQRHRRGNRRHGGLFRLGRRPEGLLREGRGRVGRDPRQAQGTAQRRRVRIPAPYRPHRVLHAGTRDRRHLRRAARGRHRPWRHARGDSRAGLRHRQLHAPRARRPRPGLPRRGARPDLGAHRAGALPRGAHHRRRPRGVPGLPRVLRRRHRQRALQRRYQDRRHADPRLLHQEERRGGAPRRRRRGAHQPLHARQELDRDPSRPSRAGRAPGRGAPAGRDVQAPGGNRGAERHPAAAPPPRAHRACR